MGEMLKDGGLNVWASSLSLEYWSKYESGTSQLVRSGDMMEGDYCARLDVDASDSAIYIFQTIALVNSRKYRLTIWYKTAAAKTAKYWLKDASGTVFLKSDGTWQTGSNDIILPTTNGQWQKYVIEFNANSSYQSYVIYFGRGASASQSIHYDSLSLLSRDGCGLLYENEWDLGTVTASGEATNFPASNTRHRWHKKTWRSAAIDVAQWLKVDRGRSTPGMKAFVVRNNNYSSSAVIKLQGNASDVWTSPTYAQTLNYNTHTIAHVLRSMQELQWWKHEITDTGNLDGYIEAGRVFLGPIFEPVRSFTLGGGQRQKLDPSATSWSEGGQISSIELERFRVYEYVFERIPYEDKVRFDALFEAMGQAKGWFFIPDLGDPQGTAVYVRFAAPLSITPLYANRWTIQMSLEELR